MMRFKRSRARPRTFRPYAVRAGIDLLETFAMAKAKRSLGVSSVFETQPQSPEGGRAERGRETREFGRGRTESRLRISELQRLRGRVVGMEPRHKLSHANIAGLWYFCLCRAK